MRNLIVLFKDGNQKIYKNINCFESLEDGIIFLNELNIPQGIFYCDIEKYRIEEE